MLGKVHVERQFCPSPRLGQAPFALLYFLPVTCTSLAAPSLQFNGRVGQCPIHPQLQFILCGTYGGRHVSSHTLGLDEVTEATPSHLTYKLELL